MFKPNPKPNPNPNPPGKFSTPNFLRVLAMGSARNGGDNGDGVNMDGVQERVT